MNTLSSKKRTTTTTMALSSMSKKGAHSLLDNNDDLTTKSVVLSRTSLYTPLSFYTSQKQSAGNNNNKKQIPKSVQDASLVEFMGTSVSTAYHYHNFQAKHARNTGNRPLTVAEINGRIRQRALTLVGGGYNSNNHHNNPNWSSVTAERTGTAASASSSTAGKRTTVANGTTRQRRLPRKKRKTLLSAQTKQAAGGTGDATTSTAPATAEAAVSTPQRDPHDAVLLRKLHALWLEYLWNLMGIRTSSSSSASSSQPTKKIKQKKTNNGAAMTAPQPPPQPQPQPQVVVTIQKQLPALLNTLELVGALVRLKTCTRHPTWVGQSGIVVHTTAETYQIVGRQLPVGHVKVEASAVVSVSNTPASATTTKVTNAAANAASDATSSSNSPVEAIMQKWIIPKRGSRLELLLPLDPNGSEGTTTAEPLFRSSSDRQLPHICILLDTHMQR
jgi:hypothetical protein